MQFHEILTEYAYFLSQVSVASYHGSEPFDYSCSNLISSMSQVNSGCGQVDQTTIIMLCRLGSQVSS